MSPPYLEGPTIPFLGEQMTCVLCGSTHRSDPRVSSNWRSVDLDGRRFYACPAHFPPDASSVEEFKLAYTRFLVAALHELKDRKLCEPKP